MPLVLFSEVSPTTEPGDMLVKNTDMGKILIFLLLLLQKPIYIDAVFDLIRQECIL